jgi:hypothetical protein
MGDVFAGDGCCESDATRREVTCFFCLSLVANYILLMHRLLEIVHSIHNTTLEAFLLLSPAIRVSLSSTLTALQSAKKLVLGRDMIMVEQNVVDKNIRLYRLLQVNHLDANFSEYYVLSFNIANYIKKLISYAACST